MSDPSVRVEIQWTATAVECLRKLPLKVRKGLLDKADELKKSDPREASKPLVGPLANHYRIVYSRYRAVYRVDEERDKAGKTVLRLTVIFVAAGIRKEQSREDVYRLAEKIVRLGVIDVDRGGDPKPPKGRG
jgi:mRNA interferase RelE/StbE